MNKKKLIPAYNTENITKEYIKSTTRNNNPLHIKNILYYCKLRATGQVVCDVIDKIIFNEKLLNKVSIVSDLSYRNCAIIISNNVVTTPHTGGYSSINPQYTYTELLKYFEEKAEKIFILLDDCVNNDNKKPITTQLEDKPAIKIDWSPVFDAIHNMYGGIDIANNNNNITENSNKITDEYIQIAMLKGELSLINDKINECLDISLIDNCDKKKYFYKTMFDELCKERDKTRHKLNNIQNT
jgi:hypothetical protein